VRHGQEAVVEWLVTHFPPPDGLNVGLAEDKTGMQALHILAAHQTPSTNTLRILLRHGADCRARDSNRNTALLLMARNSGAMECARLLLAKCPEAALDSLLNGRSPLHIAASAANLDLVSALLQIEGIQVRSVWQIDMHHYTKAMNHDPYNHTHNACTI
jgi:ankyrin repeat protein